MRVQLSRVFVCDFQLSVCSMGSHSSRARPGRMAAVRPVNVRMLRADRSPVTTGRSTPNVYFVSTFIAKSIERWEVQNYVLGIRYQMSRSKIVQRLGFVENGF